MQEILPRLSNSVDVILYDCNGNIKAQRHVKNLRTNTGGDLQSKLLGGDLNLGDMGSATAVTASTIADGSKTWVVNQWAGHVVFTGSVYAVILSNTINVATIDKWYTPNNPGGAAATNPSLGAYVIGFAMAPAVWIGLSADTTAPATADTSLTGEVSTNGLARAFATSSHVAISGGTTATVPGTYTLTKNFTATGTTNNLTKAAIFNAASGGTMMLEATFTAIPVVSNTDVVSVVWTVNY